MLTTAHLPARPLLLGRRLVGRAQRVRQAGEVFGLVEDDPGVLVGEHLVAEVGERDGQLLVDVAEALLLIARELGAGADVLLVGALEQPLLLGREPRGLRGRRKPPRCARRASR